MGMYFIMKKQTIIFSYIWSTVTEDEEMITKIRERIAEERICAFLESMSQLGFTQEQVLGLIQREREEKNA